MRYVSKRSPFLYQRKTEWGTIAEVTPEALLDFERLPEAQKLAVWVIDQSHYPGGTPEHYTVGGKRILDTLIRKGWLDAADYTDYERCFWLSLAGNEAMQRHYAFIEGTDGYYPDLAL